MLKIRAIIYNRITTDRMEARFSVNNRPNDCITCNSRLYHFILWVVIPEDLEMECCPKKVYYYTTSSVFFCLVLGRGYPLIDCSEKKASYAPVGESDINFEGTFITMSYTVLLLLISNLSLNPLIHPRTK